MPGRWLVWSVALVIGVAGGVGIGAVRQTSSAAPPASSVSQPVGNPRLDTGTALNTAAPDFTLTDQFGRKVSLSSFRGKVVVVSFNDPLCTTICPLTTTALLEAKKLLGSSAADVQLIGIGANPKATQVKWTRAYSKAHGMLHKWLFLTGSLAQLKKVWSSYGIAPQVLAGTIDHQPATFVIDPQGRETRLFWTLMSYSSVPQLAEVIARGLAADLPGDVRVPDLTSLAPVKLLGPKKHVWLEAAGGRARIELGPGHGPQLVLFFDTWEQEVSNLGHDLVALNRYAALNSVAPLTAVDEANVESSPKALPKFLHSIPHRSYPVAVDPDGRVADGYGVQNSPWLTLVSGSGKILWQYDIGDKGWPSLSFLVRRVHAALQR